MNNERVEFNLQLHAHNGSGFDTSIILDNLPFDKHIVDIIKNGKGIISKKVFNNYIQNGGKQIPQCLIFTCGKTHLSCSLKKLGETVKITKRIF